MRDVKEKRKKRDFHIKKHKVGDKIELGMIMDSGADAHMVPKGMFDLPVNEENAHGFETADGTEMPSPGTQYIPGFMGQILISRLLWSVLWRMLIGSFYLLDY